MDKKQGETKKRPKPLDCAGPRAGRMSPGHMRWVSSGARPAPRGSLRIPQAALMRVYFERIGTICAYTFGLPATTSPTWRKSESPV